LFNDLPKPQDFSVMVLEIEQCLSMFHHLGVVSITGQGGSPSRADADNPTPVGFDFSTTHLMFAAHEERPIHCATVPLNVLVVDDHAANRLLMCKQLEFLGAEIH
jgi:hypothetical protein